MVCRMVVEKKEKLSTIGSLLHLAKTLIFTEHVQV